MYKPDQITVDLSNCDREPIHILGHVQPFGCLLAVSPDWIVQHASANVETFLGVEAENLIGLPLAEVFEPEAIHDIRARLQLLAGPDAVERLFGCLLIPGREERFDLALHVSGMSIVIEIEPATRSAADYQTFVRPMIERLRMATSETELCQQAARHVKALTGFDRVMVYRFAADGSGEVVAEARKPGMEPFLGLRYPASDIPQQARALYKRSYLRIISDVEGEVSPILPAVNPEGQPLDLSLSGLRAVSPIHIEYLQNMGVGASMSISIIVRGELWGLFACHHEEARILSYDSRTTAELFGQLFAFLLDQKVSDAAREDLAEAQGLHDRLMAQLAGGGTMRDDFSVIVGALKEVIPFEGAAGWFDGEFQSFGSAPPEEEFDKLRRFLNTTAAGRVYATDHIASAFPAGEAWLPESAGLLALPVSRRPRDYIVLFRQEVARSVLWAGNPDKAVATGPHGSRLTPRKSFEAWRETVRGSSSPWSDREIRAAEALRVTLLEVVLRLSDAANVERQRLHERQELLIAELNHRVRNILTLIRGLVTQSKGEARSVADFTEVIGGRIHALARAHDQITHKNWGPSSMKRLVETEMNAYLDDRVERLQISGPDLLLGPGAFMPLSLVIHELTTNSVKYGALSSPRGRVRVVFGLEADGSASIAWREEKGPPVQAPLKRGFGSTIIERSIPYELKGQAEVRYLLAGLEADFSIPADFVSLAVEATGISVKPSPARPLGAAEMKPPLAGDVLLVEDNMIIALDSEELLNGLGSEQVHMASSVAEAERILEGQAVTFALLDVNLAAETSESLANRLAKAGIPFVFATGYGDATELTRRFPQVPVLQKPYGQALLESAIRATAAGAKSGEN